MYSLSPLLPVACLSDTDNSCGELTDPAAVPTPPSQPTRRILIPDGRIGYLRAYCDRCFARPAWQRTLASYAERFDIAECCASAQATLALAAKLGIDPVASRRPCECTRAATVAIR